MCRLSTAAEVAASSVLGVVPDCEPPGCDGRACDEPAGCTAPSLVRTAPRCSELFSSEPGVDPVDEVGCETPMSDVAVPADGVSLAEGALGAPALDAPPASAPASGPADPGFDARSVPEP